MRLFIKHLIIVLLSISAIVLFAHLPDQNHQKLLTEAPETIQEAFQDYRFHSPALANKILQKLDVFSEVKLDDVPPAYYNASVMGWLPNYNYCREHRAHLVENPDMIFNQKSFITEFWTLHQLRTQAIPMINGVDLHKEIGYDITPRTPGLQTNYKMRIDANMFFHNRAFFRYRRIGKQYSCLTQISNHIPGVGKVLRKSDVGFVIKAYSKQFSGREECFAEEKFFPKSWLLSDRQQCEEFFAEFTGENYQKLKQERGVVYLKKAAVGVHQGKGVFPVTETEEKELNLLYENGRKCGEENNSSTLIQYMVHNPLLLEGRKFDFRVYMLVASTNPMIAYSYDGYLRVSLSEYDTKSDDKNIFVTNIVLNHDVFEEADKNGEYNGMTKEEMHEKTCWWFGDLERYLKEKGKISEKENWLDNYLRPQINKVMIHLVRMLEKDLVKQSSMSELYGIDLLIDEDLNLWFIELNTMPLIHGWTVKTTKFFNKMLTDYFDIVFGLLRSRVKRIIKYVNPLKEEDIVGKEKLEMRRREFREISQNYFEREFEPNEKNKFRLIVDNNRDGVARYNGNLPANCL